MDGIHDMGGMQGFGRIDPQAGEPVFHASWEARMFALSCLAGFGLGHKESRFRPAMESMEPGHYLRASYYERWLEAELRICRDLGAVSEAELAGGPLEPFKGRPPRKAADAMATIMRGGASSVPDAQGVVARFRPGDRVATRQSMGEAHNRLPRYVRGKTGLIESVHGPFVVMDRTARGDRTPEPLYTVVFAARDLWGPEAGEGDTLSLECWDSYLEAVKA